MKVFKFGGTSVGSVQRIHDVVHILPTNEKVIVVISAMSGTTNALLEICSFTVNGEHKKALFEFAILKSKYQRILIELFENTNNFINAESTVLRLFDEYSRMIQPDYQEFRGEEFVCLGEMLSSVLLYFELLNCQRNAELISAFSFMKTTSNKNPDYEFIHKEFNQILERSIGQIILTQGFICKNSEGESDNLGRGGSDFTAAIIGNVVDADEVQIWTDIDGFHNNDPRFVSNTRPIRHLSFDEAAELAYFGAKILHPATILPCRIKNIPVRLKNTLNPDNVGTLITEKFVPAGIKAVAAKDNITAINIKSNNMLMAHGFLKRVFAVFDAYKTSVDTITTSEVAVSLTIDSLHNISEIEKELSEFAFVEIECNHTIVCVVGDFMTDKPGLSFKLFESLKQIPVRMISFGGSRNNISILIKTEYKREALNALQKVLTIPIQESNDLNLRFWLPRFTNLKTPFYFYDTTLLKETLNALNLASLPRKYKVYYAIKANNNPGILQRISAAGLGADCVSGNEILTAFENGFKASDIVYAGVGKSEEEIELAVKLNIFCFHCENLQEIDIIQQKASQQNKIVKIALRINPGVDAKTHAYITTGTRQNKFGLSAEDMEMAIKNLPNMPNLELIGLHLHIGSQILDMKVFERLAHAINEIQENLPVSNSFSYLNVGGGLGVDYENPAASAIPDFDLYFDVFEKHLRLKPNQKLHFELGRSIVAQSGSLISKVEYVKGDEEQKFVILDAGMNDLMRPALYQAKHKILNLCEASETEICDIVGPVCETTDTFARSIEVGKAQRGHLFALLSAGAYGEVMGSNYNLRSRNKCVYSEDI